MLNETLLAALKEVLATVGAAATDECYALNAGLHAQRQARTLAQVRAAIGEAEGWPLCPADHSDQDVDTAYPGEARCLPGYRLCHECLEIADVNGIDINDYRA